MRASIKTNSLYAMCVFELCGITTDKVSISNIVMKERDILKQLNLYITKTNVLLKFIALGFNSYG